MGVTREDVAKLAGVSGTTVSYVMNNTKRISPEVRQRVWDAAKQLNYHPNLLARGLATNETKHIAIIVKNLQNPYYTAIQEGIQTFCFWIFKDIRSALFSDYAIIHKNNFVRNSPFY